jgi:hypothetical protein
MSCSADARLRSVAGRRVAAQRVGWRAALRESMSCSADARLRCVAGRRVAGQRVAGGRAARIDELLGGRAAAVVAGRRVAANGRLAAALRNR